MPGWARPWAAAFDLKAFFTVIAKEPTAVTPADVFEFLAHQRGDRTVPLVRVPRTLPRILVDHDTAMSTASILVQEDTHYRSRTAQPTAAAHRTTANQAVTEHRTVGADLPGRQLECRRPEPPDVGSVTVPQL